VIDVSAFIGEFDLLVWGFDWGLQDHCWRAFEVKTADGELTKKEAEFQQFHPGAVQTVRSFEAALMCFRRC
jgi:hypothetical protein